MGECSTKQTVGIKGLLYLISLIERGDYSPSVTLALTIAKVCGVAVEEVFYLQEEEDNG